MRKSGRAIIFKDNKILLMHRIKKDSEYYTFPGGGLEDGETFEKCTQREVLEEFGINVICTNLIYKYQSNHTYQEFFLTKYISGIFGSGTGEEFSGNSQYGKYIPEEIDIKNISNINLKPDIIKNELIKNINSNNTNLKKYESVVEDYENEY